MPLDAAGEVIVGAVEVVGEVLAELGTDAAAEALAERRRRRRRGCWLMFLMLLAVAVIFAIVIAYDA
jgi:predicted nucleic acid-binding Zn ribbon protein